ncbi:hypothetical protein FEM48_Zijuj09G0221100 [Ziziphus jujuba var. spinosa]|uniref:Clp ATPase C-terminal domain-containing protein n=1 Tax=Ziziphus jujuba var. spinosa TaxID=714518 RepID=A0A978UVK8_ZIZJJ|nr:hypothetical protein FEM48_Zijuj09G0221100 [Ziziphus jujuba var. spinosa]
MQVFSVDMGRLLAGASNRGEFEKRLINIVDEVEKSKGVIILLIDEVHTLIGAGAGGQALDAANVLKPALARGCIGAMTLDKYRKYIEKDSSLKRRFTRVEVPEPTVNETIKILKGLCTKYEKHHNVKYRVQALVDAGRLSSQYIRDLFLPDKATDLIDEAGVGKTEMANTLAIEYFRSKDYVVRLDMSEYMEGHAASKFFGSPPDYIGHDEGGQLTETIRRKPHSLILFDEIKKAHRDIFNVLLQILDYGRLTDSKGHKVDFSNTLIILTLNIDRSVIGKVDGAEFGYKVIQLKQIADITLDEVIERLKTAKKIRLNVTEEFKEKLVKESNNSNYGARPLKRAIVRNLEDYLEEKILKGDIKEGDPVTLGIYKNGDVNMLQYEQKPHSLILFDEIAKAHRDIFDVLLQILDYGRLTESRGQKVDFNGNTVIILTSNSGGSVIGKSAGDELGEQVKTEVAEELEKVLQARTFEQDR